MRRRRQRQVVDPLGAIPAELDTFDPRESAVPGEEPDKHGFDTGNTAGGWDYDRPQKRYHAAVRTWFEAHPEADCIEWIKRKDYGRGR